MTIDELASGPCSCGYYGCHDTRHMRNQQLAALRATREAQRRGATTAVSAFDVERAIARIEGAEQ